MTLQQAYDRLGSNLAAVLGRLQSTDLIRRLCAKFLDDTSYTQLKAAVEDDDIRNAYLAAHTLKGVCQNLGFTRLYTAANALTVSLHVESAVIDPALVAAVDEAYADTVAILRELKSDYSEN